MVTQISCLDRYSYRVIKRFVSYRAGLLQGFDSMPKSSSVSLDIPRDVLHATRMTPKELRQELALHLFEQHKLSFGKARELSELSVGEFQQLLGSRGIPVHYDVEAYEEDLATLKRLGRL